jgi:6-phosphogluconolactonase
VLREHNYTSRDDAASAVAARIESALQRRLQSQAEVVFVVSGGTTPAAVFSQLSRRKLEWKRVQVVLSDERWVPPEHEDSNEKMVREQLITSFAGDLRLLPFYADDISIGSRCAAISDDIRELPLPFACTLLGMGEDGHFASLFPGISNLREGLDPNSAAMCIAVTTGASVHQRISLTLPALTMSDEILLLAYGEKKRTIIERAVRQDLDLPVSNLFLQPRASVDVFWAP